MAAALCMKAHDNRCSAGALILSTVHEGEEDVMVVMAQEEEEEEVVVVVEEEEEVVVVVVEEEEEEVVVVVEEEEACSLGGDIADHRSHTLSFIFNAEILYGLTTSSYVWKGSAATRGSSLCSFPAPFRCI
jgi:hypothetical protein